MAQVFQTKNGYAKGPEDPGRRSPLTIIATGGRWLIQSLSDINFSGWLSQWLSHISISGWLSHIGFSDPTLTRLSRRPASKETR